MKPHSSYWQLRPYLRSQRLTLAQTLVCTLVFTVCWPLLLWLSEPFFAVVGQGKLVRSLQLAGLAAVVFLTQKIAQYCLYTLSAKASLQIALHLRQNVFNHLQRLSIGYFEAARTGDLTYRLTEDLDRIGEVIYKIVRDFIPCVLQLIVVLTAVIYINPELTLAIVIIAPLMGLLIGWFGEQIRKFSHRSQNRVSDLSAMLTEVFSGIRLIQAFAAEDYTLEKFSQEAENNRKAKYAAERLRAIQFPIVGFLEALCFLLLLLLGAWQIAEGNLTASKFVSYGIGVAMLIDPINILTQNYNEFKQGEASIDRIFELFALEPTVIEKPSATVLPPATGRVEYCNVSFAYQPGEPVLRNLNLEIAPGEAIALVGASGAGKTTLVNLLPRFYDPQAGEILIDGINIQDITLNSLRRQIGIVPQDTTLFSGTIAQNIAFGQLKPDFKAVQEAAKIANAHQFIIKLSQGYHTWVGERGINLSGGQRQRIAIARAVLLDPRILILDEATSALDSESEALVQEALERIMKDRTVFIIAHRLATVRRADRILVVEQGRIVESGNHEELLDKGGRYARFYAQQFN
ncbi:MAG: ABC transporter ATP-binding protein [Moorea sp. SIOASIH]|uniref:ABC transporter ATP-binding protein n=1 Tax=Moorena sp. SIOASIH TaxID=2607817 RepID=UPI0013BA28DD|nr:ABC transporter ATP-binding protein [Moorena sp. SIOASIH]NEO38422.1 ABC transporter ATP-binding protein [Moorena sp. SIOASIH]